MKPYDVLENRLEELKGNQRELAWAILHLLDGSGAIRSHHQIVVRGVIEDLEEEEGQGEE